MESAIDKISAAALSVSAVPPSQQIASDAPPPEQKEKPTSKPADNRAIQELTEKIQKYLDNRNINIDFSTYGSKNEKISVTVTEKETGKVIREIPAEELQRLSVRMDELMGMIFNDQV